MAIASEYLKAAKVSDIHPGESRLIELSGHKIALFNVEGQFYAIGNTCTHKGGPLSEGSVAQGLVQCPWHGAKFDLKTGANLAGPAQEPVPSYKVEIRGEDIYICLIP
ncbi:MAG: non-heme iron oxygenase ferredoxin subunit [Candidatus Melainabacteria bacterium]|nr:non-heme iron oxygenase ferredoxin subunit [Candidatus Melainabacteria bacterium]